MSGIITAKQAWYIMVAKLERKASGTIEFEVIYF